MLCCCVWYNIHNIHLGLSAFIWVIPQIFLLKEHVDFVEARSPSFFLVPTFHHKVKDFLRAVWRPFQVHLTSGVFRVIVGIFYNLFVSKSSKWKFTSKCQNFPDSNSKCPCITFAAEFHLKKELIFIHRNIRCKSKTIGKCLITHSSHAISSYLLLFWSLPLYFTKRCDAWKWILYQFQTLLCEDKPSITRMCNEVNCLWYIGFQSMIMQYVEYSLHSWQSQTCEQAVQLCINQLINQFLRHHYHNA